MNTRLLRVGLAVAALASLATLSRADVAFSDLSPTVPFYTPGSGYFVLASPTFSQTLGAQFTSALTGNITAVSLGLSLYLGGGGDGTVNVYLEPVPSSPGLVDLSTAILLGIATATVAIGSDDGSQLTSVTLVPGLISLASNESYYLILQPNNPNTGTLWDTNNTGASGNEFVSHNLGVTFTPLFANPNTTLPAFEIDVASVPEPSSLLLVAASLLGAGLFACARSERQHSDQSCELTA